MLVTTPARVTWLPVISNSALAALKLAAGVMVGSISVLSDGVDSSIDVLSAFIAFIGVRVAARPPDEEHPYGHGRAEYISGLIESGLILGGGGFVTYQAVHRLIEGTELGRVELGMAVLVVSLLVNTAISVQLYRVATQYSSVALEAAARHRASDMLTSLGVLAGLVVVGVTGLDMLDPVIALGVAAVIFWAGVSIARKSVSGLMDPRLDAEEEAELIAFMQTDPLVLAVKHLHTARPGAYRRIEATVVMCRHLSVGDAHDACDRVEAAVLRRFPQSWITIHVEPCTAESDHRGGKCLREPQ